MIDVDAAQDRIRLGVPGVCLGYLILPAHGFGQVVLVAVRIEASPDIPGALERLVAVLSEGRPGTRFVQAVDSGREVVQFRSLAPEQREVVATQSPHLAALAHVLDDARAEQPRVVRAGLLYIGNGKREMVDRCGAKQTVARDESRGSERARRRQPFPAICNHGHPLDGISLTPRAWLRPPRVQDLALFSQFRW